MNVALSKLAYNKMKSFYIYFSRFLQQYLFNPSIFLFRIRTQCQVNSSQVLSNIKKLLAKSENRNRPETSIFLNHCLIHSKGLLRWVREENRRCNLSTRVLRRLRREQFLRGRRIMRMPDELSCGTEWVVCQRHNRILPSDPHLCSIKRTVNYVDVNNLLKLLSSSSKPENVVTC